MVFPLLGLIGLAATAAAKPWYDEWSEGKRGDRASRALDGVGPDPMDQASALMGAGLIDPAEYVGLGPQIGQLQLGRDRLNEDRRQFGLGLGLDRDRLGLDRERFAVDRAYKMAGAYDFQPLNGAITPGIMSAAKSAIAGIESGGQGNPYAAIGPVTKNGDRAIGKYQVMASNVPSWSEAALGYPMTADEFAQSPEAQEAVFEDRFGGYLDRYGTFEDAASAWFSGRPFAQAMRETPGGDGYMATADYVGQAGQAFHRRLQVDQAQQEQASALRGLELDAAEASAPYRESMGQAETVLQGLDQLSRLPDALNTAEGVAASDQVMKAGEELFHAWRKQVYGEAEPSPQALENFREIFRTPGGRLEDRERTQRYYQMMRAELGRKADYEEAKVLYRAGAITREDMQALNGGRLTREERAAIERGDWAPEGFEEIGAYGG